MDDLARLTELFLQGDADALASELATRVAPGETKERVAMVVRAVLDDGQAPAGLARGPAEAIFLDNIAAIRSLLAHQRDGTPPSMPGTLTAPPTLNELANDVGPDGWSSLQWLNHLLLRQIVPTRRLALVAAMRDEGLLLLEFVAHYRALGVEHIFIYSNDNNDGSDTLLRALAEQGVITFIDNQVSPPYHPQRKAFTHALNLLPELRLYEWAFFLDADEFFVPAPRHGLRLGNVVREIAHQFPRQLPAAICYQWRWYVSGYKYLYENELVLRRFRHALPHEVSKCLVRPAGITSMRRLHYPHLAEGEFLVNSRFETVPEADIWTSRPPVYDGGQLNHYWTKSFEEFSIKKARNPKKGITGGHTPRDFQQFFTWNGQETRTNFLPPPPALVSRVEEELNRLRALPQVDALAAKIRSRLPELLARFDEDGGLSQIYEASDPRTGTVRPAMSDVELGMLRSFMAGAINYVEFGSSGTAATACGLVRNSVITIDSSPATLQTVADYCRDQQTRLQPRCLLVDIGKTRELGYPQDEAARARWPDYHSAIWSEPGVTDADIYLINGRFRVACFLQALFHAQRSAVLLVHGFPGRSHYHVIRQFAREIGTTDQLSAFQRRPDFDPVRGAECLQAHRFVPD